MSFIEGKVKVLLGQALKEEFGLKIPVSDVGVFKRHFYKQRKSLGLTKQLSLRTSPDDPNNEVWIVKTPTEEE